MLLRAIDTKNIKKLTTALCKEGRLFGPVRQTSGWVLAEIKADGGLSFAYANFKLPPKRRFFPQHEVISRYDSNGTKAEKLSAEKTVIFGVRPCDCEALGYLDKVFCDEHFNDPYFQKRRENTLIISLACDKPQETCFCSSTGGSPSGTTGSDIQAFNLGKSL
ncbi:MAG: hypothetical protein PHC61_18135, partial [Chitinivibrionales bacterium]|nr:hypothetical protein [Chitinivibrionales bacterium]